MLLLPQPLEGNTTDAIVVPTGGAGRIDRGIALLQANQARRMLVTGVAPGVRPIDLAREYRTPTALFAWPNALGVLGPSNWSSRCAAAPPCLPLETRPRHSG